MKNQGHITTPEKMNIISIKGGNLRFFPETISLDHELKLGQVYVTDINHDYNFIELKEADSLSLPSKIYDFDVDFRKNVLKTLRHSNSNANIGVLLEGYKGQGKSVVAKQLAIESGLPIVIITGRIPLGIDINSFLGQIKQDYVLFIDEFEKLFAEFPSSEEKFHGQDSFLSILDGTLGFNHKRLVILTTNKEINDKFINRPSRIRYYKKYNHMSKELFKAIVDDKLSDKSLKQDLYDNLDVASCTIDILVTIIEEINIQEKPYSQFKINFNNKEKTTTYSRYKQNLSTKQFDYFDEVKSKREIGIESEYAQNIFGYGANVLQNDGETIFYEINEYVDDPNGAKDSDGDVKQVSKKVIYKAIKQAWTKLEAVF